MTRAHMLSRTSALAGVLWGAVALATGCTPSAGTQGTTPPGGQGTRDEPIPTGHMEGDSVPELQERLERLTGAQAARMSDAEVDTQACHDLCSLSVSICEVEVKLCEIADRHPQEGSYQKLCREAQQECQEAQTSCEDCAGEHAGDTAEPPFSGPPAPAE